MLLSLVAFRCSLFVDGCCWCRVLWFCGCLLFVFVLVFVRCLLYVFACRCLSLVVVFGMVFVLVMCLSFVVVVCCLVVSSLLVLFVFVVCC